MLNGWVSGGSYDRAFVTECEIFWGRDTEQKPKYIYVCVSRGSALSPAGLVFFVSMGFWACLPITRYPPTRLSLTCNRDSLHDDTAETILCQ